MEDLPHLIDRDLEQITESIRPENHDVPVVIAHLERVCERMVDILALDPVLEDSPSIPHSLTVVINPLYEWSLAAAARRRRGRT